MTLLERLRTYGVVTLIAVLVWLYAEGQAVKLHENEQLKIRFVAPEGQEGDLAIEPRSEVRVTVDLSASTGQMNQLKRYMAASGAVNIVVDEATVSPIVLQDALSRSYVGTLGINIEEAEPASVEISVQELREVRLPIRWRAETVRLGPSVLIDPQEVSVRLPERLAEKAGAAQVIADIDALNNLGQLAQNEQHAEQVPLKLPPELQGPWSRIDPDQPTATVQFTIRKQTETYTIPRVTVYINAPPRLLQQFDIQLDQDYESLRDLELTGPAELIRQIREGKLEVRAELRPTADDLNSGVEALQVYLDKPAEVTCDTPLPMVPVQITPVSSGE